VSTVRERVLGWFKRERTPPRPRTILVVDSNAKDRRSTADAVARLGYEAIEATTAAEALKRLEDQQPDCILLAFDLRGGSGLNAVSQIRKVDPNVAVIMLTTDWRDTRTVEAMRRGAIAYLAKPFGQDDLRELLARH
jgi:CheY-like chemotaxis protein